VKRLVSAGALILIVGCTPAASKDLAPFVLQLIERHESAATANPPASIWCYRYKGRVVFYVPPACCDVPSELYDYEGNLICGPDGGLSGTGDERCPDFFEQRLEGFRVWSDPRADSAL
jgi:hypothetical protein